VFDGPNRSDIVIVTRDQHAIEPQLLARDVKRQTQHRRGVTLPPELRNNGVADVPANPQEKVVEGVSYRDPADDALPFEGKEKRRSDMIRWKVYASFLLVEQSEVAAEGHVFVIVVEERGDVRRRGAVNAHELVIVCVCRTAKHQCVWHTIRDRDGRGGRASADRVQFTRRSDEMRSSQPMSSRSEMLREIT
jgi:hypothetical protein